MCIKTVIFLLMLRSLLIVVCCRYREPRPPVLLKLELAGSWISQKVNIILLKPKDIISKNIRETKYILLLKNPISSNFYTTFVTFPTKLKKSYSSRFTGLNYCCGLWPNISVCPQRPCPISTTLSGLSTPVT